MLGSGEIIIILCIVMLLFGGKKLPEFARSLGKGIREFKKACSEVDDSLDTRDIDATPPVTKSSTDNSDKKPEVQHKV